MDDVIWVGLVTVACAVISLYIYILWTRSMETDKHE